MQHHLTTRWALWGGTGALVFAAVNACSARLVDDTSGLGAAPGTAGGAALGGTDNGAAESGGSSGVALGGGTGAQGGGPLIDPNQGSSGEGGQAGNADGKDGGAGGQNGAECASVSATAELEPFYLAFAFDVSGSMGEGDLPWHDASLKWQPAVDATRAFLEDERSAGLFASLTSFPVDSDDETERCSAATYAEPDVPMTELPSTTFGERLDAIRASYWGDGTPTLAVVSAVHDFVSKYRAKHAGTYAVVLVTDGYPQGCGETNTIAAVEDVVSAAAGDVPTYVIGVKNPPVEDEYGNMAPDTVSDLNGVAQAGRTTDAFIIDTGDPDQTQADFREAVARIRGAEIACTLPVPEPPDGRTFQKDHVLVSTTDGTTTTDLEYDEDCKDASAWHYDSTTKPTKVVLCPSTCAELQDTARARLRVGFTCEQVITVR